MKFFRFLLFLNIFIFLSVSHLSAQITTNGLVGYWPLDGDAHDASGNGHDGVITGATPIPGKFNGAYTFHGSDGIDVGDFTFSNQEYTVSGWIRTTEPAVAGDWKTWIDKLDDSGGPFMLGIGDGRDVGGVNGAQYAVWTGGYSSVNILDTVSNLRDGAWHHYAVTYQSGSQNVYVDGNPVGLPSFPGAASFPGPLPVNSTHVVIGGHNFGPYHHPWIGDIDEVRIYDRALSPQEIQGLFGPTLSIFPGSGTFVSSQSLDVSFILQNSTLPVVSISIIFDGADRTAFLSPLLINGKIQNGRFSLLRDAGFEVGNHTLVITIQLSDGTTLQQTANWTVLAVVP